MDMMKLMNDDALLSMIMAMFVMLITMSMPKIPTDKNNSKYDEADRDHENLVNFNQRISFKTLISG